MIKYLKKKLKKRIEKNHYKIYNKSYYHLIDRFYQYCFLSDQEYIERQYKESFNKPLNIDNPETFNEKIIWLNLNNSTLQKSNLTDKLEVRSYIKETIGEKYLIPLLATFKKTKDISVNSLPDIPFIIKTNHDSGSYQIVKNKSEIDFKALRKRFNKSLRRSYYYFWRERHYKAIKPRVIVEKLLKLKNGDIPHDYKFHCSKGQLITIQVDKDRHEGSHTRAFFDDNYNLLPFSKGDLNQSNIDLPNNISEMVRLSEILSKDFSYVRVDLYNVDGIIYFGELTFTSGAGLSKFEPEEWDLKLGEKIKLPKPH